MSLDIIIGAQWGDEGKGRIVDLLSAKADYCARFSGGDNAGHTVTVQDTILKLHLIPSGIVHPLTKVILGNGMVINPSMLLKEIETLITGDIEISSERLFISLAAHLITPWHCQLDQFQEKSRGKDRIGTTGKGIGPAYMDKAARIGLRCGDILKPELFREKVIEHASRTNRVLESVYGCPLIDLSASVELFIQDSLKLTPYIKDTGFLLREAIHNGKYVLAEGAQGTLLDIDHGTYPFVTSSCTSAAGALSGLGINIQGVNRIIGVTKVFQTRVGAGPFPTELFEDKAIRLRGTGENPWDEFGTTTGRPRRVGWFDGVLLKYAVDINGLTELVLTKMDILTGLPKIQICTAYKVDENIYDTQPHGLDATQMDKYQPIYEELEGWQDDLRDIRRWEDLPRETKKYIEKFETIAGIPVSIISVGPERNQVIIR